MLRSPPRERIIRHAHMACGIGAGAMGMNRARIEVGPLRARFECAGGIDVDAGAIRNFERMTGVRGTVMDLFSLEQYRAFHGRDPAPGWREATPADIRTAFGEIDICFASYPCKGFSSLLSQATSLTDKYQALNSLVLRGMMLVLEAYRDDPVAVLIFENVPRIATRGRWLLDQVTALLRAYGYSVNEDTHNCGTIGNLAQSRNRFIQIARHPSKIPNFVYQPRQYPLRGVGEVIGKLPLPGDPRAGVMHRVPALQWRTWVRLAFVEAGKDWRSLNRLAVENGHLRDYGIVPEVDLRNEAYGVCRWDQLGPLVTSARAPGQGRFSVADPRASSSREGSGFLGVNEWRGTIGVISTRGLPTNGGYSVADPRPGYKPGTHTNLLAITGYDAAARVVSGAVHVAGGALSVADPRYAARDRSSVLGVIPWAKSSGVVAGESYPSNGTFSIADPRPTQVNQSFGQYGVRRWVQTSGTVTGQAAPGGGPNSVADPRIEGKPRFNNTFRVVPYGAASPTVAGPGGPAGGLAVADPRAPDGRHTGGKYRVTSYDMTANAVIGASTTGMGAFVVADPRCTWNANSHRNKLKVVSAAEPAGCVTTSDRVGSGAISVADPMPRGLSDERRLAHRYNSQAHYGVMGWSDTSISIPGHAKYDRGRWSVAEPRDVLIAAMPVALPKPDDRLVARIIALDDTWHRPLTTLDLGALMGFFDPAEAFPNATGADPAAVFPGFELVGGSDAMKREWTGNAVPPLAARGIAETIGEAFLLAEMGETFTLSNSDIWVKQGALALAIDNRQPAFEMDDVSDVLAGIQ